METSDKIELLQDVIESSKSFEFIEDDVLNIKDYYTNKKSININFTALIEMLCELDIPNEYIDRLLLTDNEVEDE